MSSHQGREEVSQWSRGWKEGTRPGRGTREPRDEMAYMRVTHVLRLGVQRLRRGRRGSHGCEQGPFGEGTRWCLGLILGQKRSQMALKQERKADLVLPLREPASPEPFPRAPCLPQLTLTTAGLHEGGGPGLPMGAAGC